eukprot:UN30088
MLKLPPSIKERLIRQWKPFSGGRFGAGSNTNNSIIGYHVKNVDVLCKNSKNTYFERLEALQQYIINLKLFETQLQHDWTLFHQFYSQKDTLISYNAYRRSESFELFEQIVEAMLLEVKHILKDAESLLNSHPQQFIER